jgi:C1A family cysteine protease
MIPRKIKRYGWKPDLPDQRDYLYAAPYATLAALPALVDLTPLCPPVYDQLELGSCTANAIAAALEFDRDKQRLVDFIPSRLFIYYNERVIENSVGFDSGAQIRDGIKSVNTVGACQEADWPYDVSQFATKPLDAAYVDALLDRAMVYARVMQTTQQMMGCLASGFPFVFGFTVYTSFESDAVAMTGIMPMPKHQEQTLGGHAVLAVGYDAVKQQFIVRNSWGPNWGLGGYFRMPFAYLSNPRLASDLWSIRAIG